MFKPHAAVHGAEIRGPDAMLRSFVLCSLATTATATAPRPALLQLRGGGGAKGGAVEEQPKTGKLWAARMSKPRPVSMAKCGPSG